MARDQAKLDDLAEDLTRALGIPFKANPRGAIAFRDPLRVTDWSVPLVFDGHAGFDGHSLVPTDFVGHVLWAHMRASARRGDTRPWWQCTLTPGAAVAIVESLREDVRDDAWVIGRDVLLEDPPPVAPRPRVRPLRPLRALPPVRPERVA